ncbi:MAG: hypothetical protein WAW17_02600 [Rhodococcus sp. (in: high G+C Gram-positive bacteria)]|uniref:hypothetical protein n=1 Tax=Rhodococcus sp. TaxID=1831 RepID=UPI003BAE311E
MTAFTITEDHLRDALQHEDGVVVVLPNGTVRAGSRFDYAHHRVLIDTYGIEKWLLSENGDFARAAAAISDSVSYDEELDFDLLAQAVRRVTGNLTGPDPDTLSCRQAADAVQWIYDHVTRTEHGPGETDYVRGTRETLREIAAVLAAALDAEPGTGDDRP